MGIGKTASGRTIYMVVLTSAQYAEISECFNFVDGTINTGGGASDYAYNANGALTRDFNKGICFISYDRFGSPKKVTFGNKSSIEYVYSADGIKLKTRHITAVPQGGTGSSSSNTNYIMSKDSTDYIGDFVYHNNKFSRYNWGNGYIVPTSSSSGYAYRFYFKDHQGNNRVVTTYSGAVKQVTHYYPDGVTHDKSTEQGEQKYKYNGKELDRMHGLDWYDYAARQYDPTTGMFTSMDPLCEKYYHISPYVYCAGNPVKYVDPDGRSTWVINQGGGKYQVVGGNLYDNDKNIYTGSFNKRGEFICNNSIGITTSMTSFYNSDTKDGGCWSVGSVIDINDRSGDKFLSQIISDNPLMIDDYMMNARNNKPYDFKVTNGTDSPIPGIDIYRGMPVGVNRKGQIVYTSARDVGNIAAGYIAGVNGMSWEASRIAFDSYQMGLEGLSTRNAEYYGWLIGCNSTGSSGKMENLMRSIGSSIKSIWEYFTK